MDRVIEKKKGFLLKKHGPYVVGGCLLLAMLGWLFFGNHASTLRVSQDELTISEVKRAEFKDYVRTNGQVMPIQVVPALMRLFLSTWMRMVRLKMRSKASRMKGA